MNIKKNKKKKKKRRTRTRRRRRRRRSRRRFIEKLKCVIVVHFVPSIGTKS